MQYKLIEHPKEKGEWLAVSEDHAKEGELCWSPTYGLGVYVLEERFKSEHKRIVASSIFIDKSIPLIRKEQILFDNTNEIAITYADALREAAKNHRTGMIVGSPHTSKEIEAQITGFTEGYNKRAETHPYSKDDIIKAIGLACSSIRTKFEEVEKGVKGIVVTTAPLNEILQSLKQPKEWIVEFQMELCEKHKDLITHVDSACTCGNQKIKIDKEGYVNILSIKPI